MIKDIRNLTKEELLSWLRNEAGVNHDSWFGQNLKVGNLEIQQVPEEYVDYLWFLKTSNFKSYLNIGIGKGGSFLVETIIQPKLEVSVAIDNSSYLQIEQMMSIKDKIGWMQSNLSFQVEFHDSDSVNWLKNNTNKKFDAIFIDGDHSYEGVKADYENSRPLLNTNGYIIFHDVASFGCPGVVALWNEIKNNTCIEFVKSNTCGIGIWKNIY